MNAASASRLRRSDGWLDRLSLRDGDRIIRIARKTIRQPVDLLKAYQTFRTRKRLYVEMLRPPRVRLSWCIWLG